jgi:hypothetical protein
MDSDTAEAVVAARALGGGQVTRVLEALAITPGLPQFLQDRQRCGVLWARHARLGVRA